MKVLATILLVVNRIDTGLAHTYQAAMFDGIMIYVIWRTNLK